MPDFTLKVPAFYMRPVGGFLLIIHSIAAVMFALYVFMSGYKELGPWLFDFLIIALPWLIGFQCFFRKHYLLTCLVALMFIAYAGHSSFSEWSETHATAPPANCLEGSSMCRMYNHL
jgi:hypothetical protein